MKRLSKRARAFLVGGVLVLVGYLTGTVPVAVQGIEQIGDVIVSSLSDEGI